MNKYAPPLFSSGSWLWLLATCCCFLSCSSGSVKKTQPYHDYDASVIPLVDSYNMIRLDGKNEEWSLNLRNKPSSVPNIDSVGLAGNVILLHSFETYARDTLRMPSWFVIDSTAHIENQFESRELYLRCLATSKVRGKLLSIKDFIYQMEAARSNN